MGSLLERQMRPFKPANPAPPGVIPGRPDADYQGAEIVIANAVLIPLMLCFLAARVYTRLRLTRSLGLDDCRLS